MGQLPVDSGDADPSRRDTSTGTVSQAAEEAGGMDAEPFSVVMTSRDTSVASLSICPASDAVAGVGGSSGSVVSYCNDMVMSRHGLPIVGTFVSICDDAVMPGCATPATGVTGASSSIGSPPVHSTMDMTTYAVGGSICAAPAADVTVVIGCSTSTVDASCAPAPSVLPWTSSPPSMVLVWLAP